MKVSVEIKDNKIFYSYAIGKNKENGEMDISIEGLCLIADLLRTLHKVFNLECEKSLNIRRCTEYLQNHPEFIEDYIKNNKTEL